MIQQNISPKNMTVVSIFFSLNIRITIELIIPSGRQNKFPFSDAEYSANAATIMAVCVCEMLSDIGYFCLKVKTVVKKIGYFWAVPYLQRLPKHCDSLSHSSKITEICLMKLFSLAIFLE